MWKLRMGETKNDGREARGLKGGTGTDDAPADKRTGTRQRGRKSGRVRREGPGVAEAEVRSAGLSATETESVEEAIAGLAM
jgi:hypothetical protein